MPSQKIGAAVFFVFPSMVAFASADNSTGPVIQAQKQVYDFLGRLEDFDRNSLSNFLSAQTDAFNQMSAGSSDDGKRTLPEFRSSYLDDLNAWSTLAGAYLNKTEEDEQGFGSCRRMWTRPPTSRQPRPLKGTAQESLLPGNPFSVLVAGCEDSARKYIGKIIKNNQERLKMVKGLAGAWEGYVKSCVDYKNIVTKKYTTEFEVFLGPNTTKVQADVVDAISLQVKYGRGEMKLCYKSKLLQYYNYGDHLVDFVIRDWDDLEKAWAKRSKFDNTTSVPSSPTALTSIVSNSTNVMNLRS